MYLTYLGLRVWYFCVAYVDNLPGVNVTSCPYFFDLQFRLTALDV